MPPFELTLLKGSLYAPRPSLLAYTATPAALRANAADLVAMVENGRIGIEINQRYALRDAAQAHRDLEARTTTGSSVLVP